MIIGKSTMYWEQGNLTKKDTITKLIYRWILIIEKNYIFICVFAIYIQPKYLVNCQFGPFNVLLYEHIKLTEKRRTEQYYVLLGDGK